MCIYMYIYVYMYICIYICIYIYVYVYVCVCVCVCVCVYTHTHIILSICHLPRISGGSANWRMLTSIVHTESACTMHTRDKDTLYMAHLTCDFSHIVHEHPHHSANILKNSRSSACTYEMYWDSDFSEYVPGIHQPKFVPRYRIM